MKANFKVNDSIYISEERKDNNVIYYVTDDSKETILHTFDIKDNCGYGCNYFHDYIFAWSNDKNGKHLSIDAIYDVNKKRNISLNPDDANKYMHVFIYTRAFNLKDVLTLINNWDYKYGKNDSFREMIDYLTGGDKEISRECIIDYVCRRCPKLRVHCSYKEPISALSYAYIALDLGTDSLSFHMMPQVITDNSSEKTNPDDFTSGPKRVRSKND